MHRRRGRAYDRHSSLSPLLPKYTNTNTDTNMTSPGLLACAACPSAFESLTAVVSVQVQDDVRALHRTRVMDARRPVGPQGT